MKKFIGVLFLVALICTSPIMLVIEHGILKGLIIYSGLLLLSFAVLGLIRFIAWCFED